MKSQLKGLEETLKAHAASLEAHAGSLPKPLRRAVRRHVLLAVRNLLKEISIVWMVEKSLKKFQALKGKKGLKVHLGCGPDIRPGFVNIDLRSSGKLDQYTPPDGIFINFDLRLGLPLEQNSCDFIYSSHFFEHLTYEEGVRLMRDCYKALRSGGVFRMALPDLRIDFDAYLRGDDEVLYLTDPLELYDPHLTSVVKSGTMTRVDWINYGVYQSGEHKYIYDEEKATLLLQQSGFSSVATSSYREGIDVAEPIRRDFSFYIEATK